MWSLWVLQACESGFIRSQRPVDLWGIKETALEDSAALRDELWLNKHGFTPNQEGLSSALWTEGEVPVIPRWILPGHYSGDSSVKCSVNELQAGALPPAPHLNQSCLNWAPLISDSTQPLRVQLEQPSQGWAELWVIQHLESSRTGQLQHPRNSRSGTSDSVLLHFILHDKNPLILSLIIGVIVFSDPSRCSCSWKGRSKPCLTAWVQQIRILVTFSIFIFIFCAEPVWPPLLWGLVSSEPPGSLHCHKLSPAFAFEFNFPSAFFTDHLLIGELYSPG